MKNIFACVCAIVLLSGCSDIFEKPISNSSVEIYTPADSAVSKKNVQQFYWEKVENASNYRLQIASPGFASAQLQSFVLDTIVTTNKVDISLDAGEYEWRLRAQNGGSQTAYFTRKLFITQAAFNERQLLVTSPSNTVVTYSNSVYFSWRPVSGSMKYYIEIDTLSGSFTSPEMKEEINAFETQKYVELKKRGSYRWRMYADSAGIKSMYSSTGRIDFKLDTVSLGVPISNKTDVPTSQVFSWSVPANAMSTDQLTYKFYILNSTDPADVFIQDELTTTKTAEIKNMEKGKVYYWAVEVYDQFGIKSGRTALRKFTVVR
jgi:uncharacterized protein YegP (UPF0339 family)